MAAQVLPALTVTILLIVLSIVIAKSLRAALIPQHDKESAPPDLTNSLPEPTTLVKTLVSAFPDDVILPQDAAAFRESMNSYWAQQECEVTPACVVRPRHVQQLCTAVKTLKHEYETRKHEGGIGQPGGLFAVRSGGHCPVHGAASISGGILIDLSLFSEVTPSKDGSSVVIGTGCKWMDVSKILDQRGLAVVGGRNSAVGVGGLTLGGGVSFFTPQSGLVCSNVISYEIVLASGEAVTASASSNTELWKALKGGGNNFGIVTRFTVRSFPSTEIWSGFLYMPGSQANKVLAAFHEFLDPRNARNTSTVYDNHASGPLVCFSHVQKLGIHAIAVNLVYTKAQAWPTCWKTSSFAKLWRFWSTCKIRTLTSATDEMNVLNPPGRRQIFAPTTIKNDPATIDAAYKAYREATHSIRHVSVKGLVWTLVLQPLLPQWVRKGDANPLGFENDTDDPLVMVNFTINWSDRRDDDLIKSTLRRTIGQIDAFAAANKTGHIFRYLNYCAEWQKPFEGYGEDNLNFLQEVSKKYDPEGLFQSVGGFKLGLDS